MGKKTKVGKQRKDKFYHLAKETGYRARSAFKLIQLNRKFQFLSKSRVLLDLCAAPGGWLQVAAKNMPISSLIIGVDLFPIRAIPNVITLQADITTEKCRQALRKELHQWKCDTVVHDGAPNVGTSWVYDAFQQAQLTLHAAKLGCEFLNKGGWFITKVFRSKDYQVLLWVFNQLFKKVHATKPQASRNESAEIYVVCQGYLAPDKIDPKFFDPKYIFKEVDLDGPKKMTIFQDPAKAKKAKAEGYEEGNYLQHKVVNVSEYLASDTPADILNSCSELKLDDEAIAKHQFTTTEVKHCIQDIRVLGKKEIKLVLKWHMKFQKLKKAAEKKLADENKPEVLSDDSETEEAKIEAQLEKLKDEESAVARRKKKDLLKKRRKLRERLNKALQSDTQVGGFLEEQEENMFDLKGIKSRQQLTEVDKGGDGVETDEELSDEEDADEEDSDESDSDLPSELDEEEAELLRHQRSGKSHEDDGEEDDGTGYAPSDDEDDDTTDQNPLMVDLDNEDQDVKAKRRTNLWFNKAAFSGIDDDLDEDVELSQMTKSYEARGGTVIGDKTDTSKTRKRVVRFNTTNTSMNEEGVEGLEPMAEEEIDELDRYSTDEDEKAAAAMNGDGEEGFSDDTGDDDSDYDDNVMLEGYAKANTVDEEEEDEDEDLRTIKPQGKAGKKELKRKAKAGKSKQENRDGFEIVAAVDPAMKLRHLDPEGLALGTLMVTSKKKRREIMEHSYHRYTKGKGEESVPKWFAEDEMRHRMKQTPVTKELVSEYKARLQEINSRPIKKIAEAKARKKFRTHKKMEKLKKKATSITDTVDMSDKEKVSHIKKLYAKAGMTKQKKVTYVVSKRALAGKTMQRPRGVKGPYKVVDARLKKDMRAQKRLEKHGKKKRKH